MIEMMTKVEVHRRSASDTPWGVPQANRRIVIGFKKTDKGNNSLMSISAKKIVKHFRIGGLYFNNNTKSDNSVSYCGVSMSAYVAVKPVLLCRCPPSNRHSFENLLPPP